MAHEPTHRTLAVNGISMHVAEEGEGPLVILCHGWPELGYSWRHQLPAIAAAGFRAVAPDMRGYGGTSAPEAIADYGIFHLVGDVVGLVAALGETQAIVIGHDWGAPVAWHAAMFRPDIFRAVAGLSVPPVPRAAAAPLPTLRKAGLDTFYWIYFQEPGVAEAEFERDPASTIRRLLCTGIAGSSGGRISLTMEPGKGFLDNSVEPERLPPWLTEADIGEFAGAFSRTGFRGGLNWYRNIDRNWELTAPWQGARINQPAFFIAGSRDGVIRGPIGERALAQIDRMLPNLRGRLIIEGAGHWIQQERPDEVNAALLGFLAPFTANSPS